MGRLSRMILSYGEDPLTYDIISTRLGELLGKLRDGTSPSDVVVIYRPSFGRGMGAHKSVRQSTFGEFDAIVASEEAVYFIESKWHRSSEIHGCTVEIRGTQVARHQVLRWYRKRWSTKFRGSWESFVELHKAEFEREFPTSCLPPPGSILSENIEFVLGQLESFPKRVVDVVLFVGPRGERAPDAVEPSGFKLVTLFYDGIDGTGYFEIGKQGQAE